MYCSANRRVYSVSRLSLDYRCRSRYNGTTTAVDEPTWRATKQRSHRAVPFGSQREPVAWEESANAQAQPRSDMPAHIYRCPSRCARVLGNPAPVSLSVDQTNAREESVQALLTLSAAALVLPSSRPPPLPRVERQLTGQEPSEPFPCNGC